jgi:diamine N-acetyltransferase
MAEVTLRPVNPDNLRRVLALEVAPDQQHLVAPNMRSLAEAAVSDDAMFRAIYAGEEPVGFLMVLEQRSVPRYYLWRFMIDKAHQGNGYGTAAVALLIEYVRGLPGATELYVSWVPGEGSPAPFYRRLGFVETGRVEHGEHEAVLALS